MSTSISSITSLVNANAQVNDKKQNATEAAQELEKPTAASLKASMNRQIVESALKVSINSGNQSQELLLRTALDRISDSIGPAFESKITPDYVMPSNGATSPEAAADMILSFSLGLFSSYAAQHKGEDAETMVTNFVELVRGGFEKGFKEAVDILEALKVFNGSIADEIYQTYDLVMQGYDNFIAKMTPTPEGTSEGETAVIE